MSELNRLIGIGSLDPLGYVLLAAVVIVIAALCMLTSRFRRLPDTTSPELSGRRRAKGWLRPDQMNIVHRLSSELVLDALLASGLNCAAIEQVNEPWLPGSTSL